MFTAIAYVAIVYTVADIAASVYLMRKFGLRGCAVRVANLVG